MLHRIPNRITLPPLRERSEDITILAEEFLQRAVHQNKAMGRNIESDAMDMLLCKLTDVWTHEQHEQAWRRNKKGELYGVPLCKRRE